MVERVSADDVIGFRLQAHHLTERLGAERLLEAAGRCAVQDSPPGSALLALHARVRNVTSARLDAAVATDKTLLRTWSMRGAPFCFPTADAPVFTTGALPPTERALRHLLTGVGPALDQLGMSLTDVVGLVRAEIGEVLSGRQLAIGDLGGQIAPRIAGRLPDKQRRVWEQDSPYAPGQLLGEAVVHFGLRILTLQGVVCFAARAGTKFPFVLVADWLGRPLPTVSAEAARAELLRRYLSCYGPSTPAHFAAWLGVQVGDVDPWWRLVADELAQVEFGSTSWMLRDHLAGLRSAPRPRGVRLLPPRDLYTQLLDRDTIVNRAHQRQIWRTVGEPGTVLVDGRIVGTWRSRKRGRTLDLRVSAFDAVPARAHELLKAEADQVGSLRDASTVRVEYAPD